MTTRTLLAPVMVLTACAGDARDDARLQEPRPDDVASVPTDSPTAEGSAPAASNTQTSATSTAPATTATATATAASSGTCLMWYACGCNVGCSKIAEPRASLTEGMSVRVIAGVQMGEKGFVEASKDKLGRMVFSLSHQKPGEPGACSLPDPRYLGYGCMASKSGDLDAHSCDAGCP